MMNMLIKFLLFSLITCPMSALISPRSAISASCSNYKVHRVSFRQYAIIENALIPLAAGALSGAIGVGVAYPVDTIKTKSQAFATSRDGNTRPMGLIEMFSTVFKNEGIKGFYGGVAGVMFGQSFIKSSAFASNAWALSVLSSPGEAPNIGVLALAAAFSGFVSGFVINPIERIKVLMQADSFGRYSSEIECLSNVLKSDGIQGLVLRGIDATLSREIPGNALYFMSYSLLMRSPIGVEAFGDLAPLVCGASAGCISWLPVYPVDVVKTTMQNTQGIQGQRSSGMLATAIELRDKYGYGVFYDGITPKLIRASINHAVTFYTYENLIKIFEANLL